MTTSPAADLPPGEPAPGISRELADWRSARYQHVRYQLRLRLPPALDRVQGHLTLRFAFRAQPVDLVLDWRPSAIDALPPASAWGLRVNGLALPMPEARDDHLLISAAHFSAGENQVELEFRSPVAPAGTAVTRYDDREDGSAYVYSLLVPADASSLFPCLDQPDLKARFTLEMTAPARLVVVGNAPRVEVRAVADETRHRFAETEPISSYLFAFAAGPFAELADHRTATRLFVRKSREARAMRELKEVLRLNRESLRFFEDYFARALPFAKYDLVLVPEFAFGGMEHAGATFLREDAVLFPFEPAAPDLLRRAQLIFHEASHQWFGNLVTMRWFDDLWLKEGFANLMAAQAAAAIVPELDPRSAFRALKTAAYRTDVTAGTTPIWQALPNLSAAKSAYGSIVYSKAPAVLRQAQAYLGEDVFRHATQAFLAQHAYGSASWSDLVHAFERESGRDLQRWAQAWVKRPGLPRVRAEWRTGDSGAVESFRLVQDSPAADTWPMRVQLLLAHSDGSREVFPVTMEERVTKLDALAGKPAPRFVFANYEDWGYGLFELDAASRDALLAELGSVEDGFLRALLWDALWESVRDANLPPIAWIELALRQLPSEQDEVTVTSLLGYLQTKLRWYLSDAQREALQPRVEATLRDGMLRSPRLGLRIGHFRAFVAVAQTAQARADLRALLSDGLVVPDLTLRSADRFRIVRTLLALGDDQAEALLAVQIAADGSDDGRRFAFAAAAARGDCASKQRYFEAFMSDPRLPERWIEEALPPFNTVGQEEATLAYLAPALNALPQLKGSRRIFFVNNWLAAFIGGQRGAGAETMVQEFLRQTPLDPDLRLKVLEALDGLSRTVRIRAMHAGSETALPR